MFHSLADFLEDLERAGQLRRVSAAVDAELEMAAITHRVAAAGGPAIFFENVKGHHPPVVTNLLGSEARICRAAGAASLEELAERVAQWLSPAEPEGWLEKIKGPGPSSAKSPPRVVKSGLCQQVVKLGRDVNLAELPTLKCWPAEARRTITAGRVLTRDPITLERAIENVTIEVLDRDRLGMVWHPRQRGLQHLDQHAKAGTRMPVAIALGGDPVYALAASPLPREVESFSFAATLRGKPVELVKCRTHDLEVPVDADLIIEGFVDPVEPAIDSGTLAGTGGYYQPPSLMRPLQVAAVTHRTNPIFSAVVSGSPPCETTVMAGVLSRLFLPLAKRAIPELVDYNWPLADGPRDCVALSIRKTFPQQAHKVASALWGLDHLMCTKLVVIVDEHVNVHDYREVMLAVAANAHPGRDVFFHSGPAHPLDYAAPQPLVVQHLAIDATAKLAGEHPRAWPERQVMNAEIEELISGRWNEYGLGGE